MISIRQLTRASALALVALAVAAPAAQAMPVPRTTQSDSQPTNQRNPNPGPQYAAQEFRHPTQTADASSGSALAKPYEPGRGGTVITRVSPQQAYLHTNGGMVAPQPAYLHVYGGMAATHLPPQPTPVAATAVGSPSESVSTTSLVVAVASLCGVAFVAGVITREVLARRRTLGMS